MEKQLSINSSKKFAGKTVLVTGSGTGIGQAIAKKFAYEGANIVIMGRRKEPLEQTIDVLNGIASSVRSSARMAMFAGVDVADELGITAMVNDVKNQFGRIDIVVNNAGVSGPVKAFTNAEVKEFRDCVAIHLTGTFWTAVSAIKAMDKGGKVITISTFFSEENRYEQRPYRFRTPYTAAQGAKNRLAEALAWELAEADIRSIATNPGPVHSDRIYKTVYPKAAAEFVRIGGYPGLTPLEIEKVVLGALPVLGDAEDIVSRAVRDVASSIAAGRQKSDDAYVNTISQAVSGALNKIQEIAEKIQNNTSKMIVDGEFLTQDDVAEMVATLADDKISSLVNGRVIPDDRVFYPVKPIVGTVPPVPSENAYRGKVVIVSTTSSMPKDIERVKSLANLMQSGGAKQVIVLTSEAQSIAQFGGLHSHALNLLEETAVRNILKVAKSKFGSVDTLIHLTGDYDYSQPLKSMSRTQWNELVDRYINIPGLLVKEVTNAMAPDGATAEPSKYKESAGTIILVGPDAPVGSKISGVMRARSDIFRGALRPYTATVNQELADVLGSRIRVYLIFAGNSEGKTPDNARLENSIATLVAGIDSKSNEAIFYIDEIRK